MKFKLSHTKIDSFCGDVVSLCIISDKDVSKENIKWYTDNENVSIRDFSNEPNFAFNDKVLVTLRCIGVSTVCAEIGDEKLCCDITVRERRRFKKGDK